MGYSCTRRAAWTMDSITDRCIAETNSSNVFRPKGESYFWERGREQSDGSMTAHTNGYSRAKMPAGYYLYVQPVDVDEDGNRSFMCFTNKSKLLEEAVRYFPARLHQLGMNIAEHPVFNELIEIVRAEQAGQNPLSIR